MFWVKVRKSGRPRRRGRPAEEGIHAEDRGDGEEVDGPDPEHATGIEGAEESRLVPLAEHDPGDQVAREDEEQVDRRPSPADDRPPPLAQMCEQHGQGRQAAEAVQLGDAPHRRLPGGCCGKKDRRRLSGGRSTQATSPSCRPGRVPVHGGRPRRGRGRSPRAPEGVCIGLTSRGTRTMPRPPGGSIPRIEVLGRHH